MSKFLGLVISVLVSVAPSWAQAAHPIAVMSDGWTVTADADHSTLTISSDKLGTVLEDVRLSLKSGRGLLPLKDWTVEKKGLSQLAIRTREPRTDWLFELYPKFLKVSSTTTQGVLTGEAPAPPERIVARLLDPEGIPVLWEGTPEVEDGYGGKQTRNETFLPRRNAEVMYFGLGQVSSLNVHSLFDRKTDTAIQFSDRTRMPRDPEDSNFLEVTIPVPVNTLVRVIPDYYTKSLHVPHYVPYDDLHFRKAPMAWNSWDNYYESVTEGDIVRNTDWIAKNLKPYGFQYIVLDDGYDRGGKGTHFWIENWDKRKFPHGPHWLANYIKSKGLIPGLWLVPNSYGGAVTRHPDWYLRYGNGKIVEDYHTPALDSTNPAVMDFLKREFTILNNWGFEYYKFDGEYAIPAYVPKVDKNRLYDKLIDPLAAYRNRLKVIRETIGPKRFIEGCPAGTPLNGIGYFDSYFYGDDMRPTWEGNYALLSSLNANAFLNHIVTYTMAGEGVEIGPPMSVAEASKKRVPQVLEAARARENPLRGFGTTTPEARTLVTYLALSGVVYSLSSVMPELPPGRVKLLTMTLPTMPILPIDLFSRGGHIDWQVFNHTTADDYIHNYPRILDLKVHARSGIYDVVGLTNWRGNAETRVLSFERQLGLDPTRSYVAFDFWNQKLYGVFRDRMKVDIQPHDTRVFLIHPMLERPQLIGTSRHITGAYSILGMSWDASKHQLRGTSQGVPGENYTLWIYVPQGEMVFGAAAASGSNQQVPVDRRLKGNLLKVTFQGRSAPINWKVTFSRKIARLARP